MRISLIALAAASLAAPGGLAAQTTAPSTASSDEPIVVTANKIGAALDKAPVAGVAVSRDTIERLNLQSVRDTQITMPSVVFDTSGGSAQVYIRGIGTNSAYAGLESSIGTYQDGVYLQRQVGASLDIVDLARIEVLNGPQGSLYGRNATGGVILVTTRDPVQRFEGSLDLGVGSFNTARAEGIINVPLSSDVAVRLAGKFAASDGYVRNVANGQTAGGFSNGTIRGKLAYSPSSAFTAVLGVEYSRQLADPVARRRLVGAPSCTACAIFGENLAAPGDFYQVDQTPTAKTLITYTAGTLNLHYDADSFAVTSVTGYRNFTYKVFVDQDFAAANLFRTRAEEFGWTFTHDTYLRTKFDGPLNALVGLSGQLDHDTLLGQFFGLAFGPLQGGINNSRVELRSISPYAEVYLTPASGLKLTLGGRYNIDEKALHATNDATAVRAPGGNPVVDQKITFRNFTPRAVLSYETGDATVYASVSKGAKSGGYNTPALRPLIPLRPEKLTSYEVGAKGTLLDPRVRLGVAAFYYDYKDIQVSFVDANSGGVRAENAATARVYGLEGNAGFTPLPGLNVNAAATLLDAKFKAYTSAAIFCSKTAPSPGFPGCPAPTGATGLANGVADLSGTRLPRAPKLSFSLSADYTFPVAEGYEATLTIADRYTGNYNFLAGGGGPLGLSRQKAFHMVTASASLLQRPTGFRVRAFVENLANANYYFDLPTSAFGVAGSVAAPRSYGLSAGFTF